MLVSTNIRLERMLLHSFATSRVKPGIVRKKPSCDTGTPAAVNKSWAANADHCCRNVIMWASMNSGAGTSHNKKPSGNRKARATALPKHRTNAPAHQITTASMLNESRASGGNPGPHSASMATVTDTTQIADPQRNPGLGEDLNSCRSRKISAATMGRTRRIWVYSSRFKAKEKAAASARHSAGMATPHNTANRSGAVNLVISGESPPEPRLRRRFLQPRTVP